jgi:hypothetical protein
MIQHDQHSRWKSRMRMLAVVIRPIREYVAKVAFAVDHETGCPLRRDATLGGALRFATGPYSANT